MATRRRWWMWVGGSLVLLYAIAVGFKGIQGRQDEVAYQEQLRLARAEGLPTTDVEFEATIPHAEPSENAALLYRQLADPVNGVRHQADTDELARALLFDPSSDALRAVEAHLKTYRPRLDLVDRAVELPRCWLERRWIGPATLFPEYSDMKTAAKLVAMRGTLAAHQGRAADAIDDAQRIFKMAQHVGEEPLTIAGYVRDAIYDIGLTNLAYWSFVHRDRREYSATLTEAVAAYPRPDLKREHRGDLYDVLSMVELCSTPQGRAEIGLSEDDLPKEAERLFPLFLSQSKARIKIVESVRASWAALDRPPSERTPLRADAQRSLYEALLAFPTAAGVYGRLTSGAEDQGGRVEVWEAGRQRYVALARALEGPVIPKTLAAADLLSPFDGKPLTYKFDGKQITITVSRDEFLGGPRVLKVPTDAFAR